MERIRVWKIIPTAIVVGLLLAVLLMVPRLPFYAEGPGPTTDVAPLIELGDERTPYPSDGTFLITTVSQYQDGLTPLEMMWVFADPDLEIVPEEDVLGSAGDLKEALRIGREQMMESQVAAVKVALEAAEGGLEGSTGVLVAAVAEGCPGAGKLFAGDEIIKVDGERVLDDDAFTRALDAAEATVALEVRDGDRTRKVQIEREACIEGNEDPVIGGLFIPVLPDDIQLNDDGIGGPSAGLAFALGLFDRLTEDDLTDGRTVAATGALGLDGSVYPVGGIDKKMAAARDAGADVFLVPAENARQLEGIDTGEVDVIGVASFEEAVEALGGATLANE